MEFGTVKGTLEGTPQNKEINQPAQDFVKSVEWHDHDGNGIDDKVTTYESGKVCVDYYVSAASVGTMGEDNWGKGIQGGGNDRVIYSHRKCD
jgi:hypothetical protein